MDATQPPALRALHLGMFQLDTVFTYTLEDLRPYGISREAHGQNRTLRPGGLVLASIGYADTAYWTDAGAGAILGLRFDGSGLRVLARDLRQPEALAIDASSSTYKATGAHVLYFGDSGANCIQRCVVVGGDGTDGAGNCSSISTVVANVRFVAGLAFDSDAGRLYWSDGMGLQVMTALVDAADGAISLRAPVIPYITMPSALHLELAYGLRRLYVADQESPATVRRLWLDEHGKEVEGVGGGANASTEDPFEYGLSRPRAIATADTFAVVADSGRKALVFAGDHNYKRVWEGPAAFEPRGVAVRFDASLAGVNRAAAEAEAASSGNSTRGEGATSAAASATRGRRGVAVVAIWTALAVGLAASAPSSSSVRRRR